MIAAMCVMTSVGQNEWEVPQQSTTTVEQLTKEKKDKKEKAEKKKDKKNKELKEEKKDTVDISLIPEEDRPYIIKGSVPMVNGDVVFTFDIDIEGKSAQNIYDSMYAFMEKMTKDQNQADNSSRIVLINKKKHIIVAKYNEWLVFSDNFFVLDRTKMNYTMIATCTDGHLNVTISRINYKYMEDTADEMKISAEKWISDEYSLNSKRTRLLRNPGKFRKKTIDRKNSIFAAISSEMNAN